MPAIRGRCGQKPLEGKAGLLHPEFVLGREISLKAGGHRSAGLDRLLVELRTHAALLVKAVGTDGAEVAGPAVCTRMSQRRERNPASSALAWLDQRPLRISACDSSAFA